MNNYLVIDDITLFSAILQYFDSLSMPIHFLSSSCATFITVPLPEKTSITISPLLLLALITRFIIFSGNWTAKTSSENVSQKI